MSEAGVFDAVVRTLVRGVALREGMPAHRIFGPGREPEVTLVRHAAILEVAAFAPSATRAEIASAFGLGHSTVARVLAGRVPRRRARTWNRPGRPA
jgi:hypothetical protein